MDDEPFVSRNDCGSVFVFPRPPSIGTDIAPGTSLSGFEFLFESSLGDIPFTYTFTNPAQPTQPLVLSGTSSTTSSAPEPNSLMLVGIGTVLIGMVGFNRHRGRFPRKPTIEERGRSNKSLPFYFQSVITTPYNTLFPTRPALTSAAIGRPALRTQKATNC